MLHLTGYDISKQDLKDFRQWKSKTPGHPEYNPALGVEMTTGPLGQGLATGVGMAMAERYGAERYNRPGYELFNYNIYSIAGDGDIMEGVTSEAASLAGHLGLGKLVYLYSDNRITIEGSTDLCFTEDVAAKFEAMKWHVQKVDGNDLDEVAGAIEIARDERERPSLIIARTSIGFGSPGKQDNASAHGAPLGSEEVRLAKEKLGWPLEPSFHIPDESLALFREAVERGSLLEKEWTGLFDRYAEEYPELSAELGGGIEGAKEGALNAIPAFGSSDGPVATRSISGKVLNAMAKEAPFLVGGSADLGPSNNTLLNGFDVFTADAAGRNIHFGVREHAMGAILNGMALSGLIVPYGGTFLVFSDYMKPAIRLAALMGLKVVYIFTHDSIGLGEDGPTHQPVEHLAALRAIPGLTLIRPADARETASAWRVALTVKGPVALALTRQKVEVVDDKEFPLAVPDALEKGAYVVADPPEGKAPELIIIATGSELHLAIEAYRDLTTRGVKTRVISMPSFSLFESQDGDYKESVLPKAVRARMSVEAGSSLGWGRYVGIDGKSVALDRFGASAPYQVNYEKLGFSKESLVERALSLI